MPTAATPELPTLDVAIEHRTRLFRPRYELRMGILFPDVQQAIIETHKLLDHVVLVEKYEIIRLKDLYNKTLVRRFITPVQRSKFREQMVEALHTLKGYLAYSAAPNPDTTFRL